MNDTSTTTPDWEAIIAEPTYLSATGKGLALGGGIVRLSHLDETQATFRWGYEQDGEASRSLAVNKIGTKGYMRFEVRNGQWSYDGGNVYRTDQTLTPCTDDQRSKLIVVLRDLVATLPANVEATHRLKNARSAVERSLAKVAEAEDQLNDARVAAAAARKALGDASSNYLSVTGE
jgi:hypothetical protein